MTTQQDPQNDDVQAELARLKEIAARAQADLQNAKARMQKEAQEIRTFAVLMLIEKLLPTIDNLQRAFDHLPKDLAGNEWVKGVQAVESQLMRELESVGLKKIEALNMPLDATMHEVVQTVEGEKDVVMTVLENGYELNGKIIRPAKVIVGK